MIAQELYIIAQPVWDKWPETKPEGIAFWNSENCDREDRFFYATPHASDSLSTNHATAIIGWAMEEWLMSKQQGNHFICQQASDCFAFDSHTGPTRIEALAAACMAMTK